ncbi:phage holin family protein [Morganella morganii]|uniref:phage holin family protein n=1 Tax=Morganella morganii TaxID=582 RepID=UPI0021A78CBE|nr:phage holin family protein [Morganella morganii]
MSEKYSSSTAYIWGLITSVLGVLSLEQWAMLIGNICTVGTFLVNWYYKRKDYLLRIKGRHHKK